MTEPKDELTTTESGFVYAGNRATVVCSRSVQRGENVYAYSVSLYENKRVGQIIFSKKLPYEDDTKRDNKIKEVLLTKVGLSREEAEDLISGLVDSFNALPQEELEKLKKLPEKEEENTKKRQYNPLELFESLGEAFEGISVYNEPVTCYNKGVIYEHKTQRQHSKSGAQSYRTEYNLHCMKLSKYVTSNANYPIAVVTPGHILLQEGEIELYIRPSIELIKDKSPLGSPICDAETFKGVVLTDELRIESTEKLEGEESRDLSCEEMWENFLNSARVFEITTPVPLDELKNIKNIENVIELALTDGLNKDSGLVTFMKIHIPKPDPSDISPGEYMPYAPNGIIVTNTKVGKTTTAQRISPNVVNRPTAPNLLGFSTADETHVGLLDGQVDTCFIDEYTESVDENVSHGLLSYMETGTTKTARGHGIEARGYAPIVFMGNPKIEGVSEYDLLDYFRNNINQITNNPQALGSRIGFLVFENAMDRALGAPYNRDISRKALMVLKTLQIAFKGQFTDLFKNPEVLKWLNTPFEDWYVHSLTDAENKSSLIQVKEFINGLKEAHRHVRGAAIHIAFAESYEVLLTSENLKIQEFLEKSEHWYQYLCLHTVQTLNQIVSIRLDNATYIKILESTLDYIKLFVKTAFLFDLDSSAMLPLDALEEKYAEIATEKGKYVNFGNLKNNLLKNVTKSNDLLKRYGLKLTDFNGIVLMGIANKELHAIFRAAYREKVSSLGSLSSNSSRSEPSEPDEPGNLSSEPSKVSTSEPNEPSEPGIFSKTRKKQLETCTICNDSLKEGEGVKFLHGRGLIHPSCKFLPMEVEVLADIPQFMGEDEQPYGPLKKGDVKRIPALNAFTLMGRDAVRKKEQPPINLGIGKSQRDRIRVLREIIKELQHETGGAASLTDIVIKGEASGINVENTQDMIQKLKSAGEIIEVSNERYRVV